MLLGRYLFDEESTDHALRAMVHNICGFSHKFVKEHPESREFLDRKGKSSVTRKRPSRNDRANSWFDTM